MLANRWIDEKGAVLALFAMRALAEDCRRHVVSYLPIRVWARCELCGVPLMTANDHGALYVADWARFSSECCDYCYWREL